MSTSPPTRCGTLIEAAINDETVRDRGVAALEAYGPAARHELEVFRSIVPEALRQAQVSARQRVKGIVFPAIVEKLCSDGALRALEKRVAQP